MTPTQSGKLFLLTIFSLTIPFLSFGQDGSNIIYVKTPDLNETHLDKKVHFDFYSRSFGGVKVDTISIAVTGNSVKFLEHREDNGFNNWFSRQYLYSLDSIGGFK